MFSSLTGTLNGSWFLQIVDVHVGNFYMKLTGRWFPQIVQWESISNIYIAKIVVLVSEPVRGRSRATELPCCTYVSTVTVMRSAFADILVPLVPLDFM